MRFIEYHDILDKTLWERGQWDHEPDKVQWLDPYSGYPCLVRRLTLGFLGGYVGVPFGHPLHELDTFDDRLEGLSVHGGVNWASETKEGSHEERIGAELDFGEVDNFWWFGFDCGHSHDYVSIAMPPSFRLTLRGMSDRGIYRSVDYVKSQCESLAAQLKSIRDRRT